LKAIVFTNDLNVIANNISAGCTNKTVMCHSNVNKPITSKHNTNPNILISLIKESVEALKIMIWMQLDAIP